MISSIAVPAPDPNGEHQRLLKVAGELVDQNTQFVAINDSLIGMIRELVAASESRRPPGLKILPDPRPGDEGC